jgi:hypothetical protein
MAGEPRFCSNCRTELSPKAEECPSCGVFAGELYDVRMHRPKTRYGLFATLLVLALAGGAAAIWWNAGGKVPPWKSGESSPRPPSVRVVGDRPGGAKRARGAVVNEAEAIRLVRSHLEATRGNKNECVVLLGNGFSDGGYVVTARDHCTATRLGKFRVDGKTGEVSPAR